MGNYWTFVQGNLLSVIPKKKNNNKNHKWGFTWGLIGGLMAYFASVVGDLGLSEVKSSVIPTYFCTVGVGHAINKCITPV